MITMLVCLSLCDPPSRTDLLLRTWNAVCWVESKGDPRAYNQAEDAAGIAQIRPIMLQDANRIIGYPKYTLADRWSPVRSYEIFRLYSLYYAPNGTPEVWARNWCAGPKGHTKPCSLPYWRKVKAQMCISDE